MRGQQSPLLLDLKMINRNQIIAWAEEALMGTDRFVVDVLVRDGNVILVFLDADSALTIAHCIEVSRFIESKLDRDEEDFELRVSSAGLDQPLQLLRQYHKNIGRSLSIECHDESKITGKLIAIEQDKLVLETFITKKQSKIKKQEIGDTIKLPFEAVKEAKIIISFN
jgi:ribosome maturation factor RimP